MIKYFWLSGIFRGELEDGAMRKGLALHVMLRFIKEKSGSLSFVLPQKKVAKEKGEAARSLRAAAGPSPPHVWRC